MNYSPSYAVAEDIAQLLSYPSMDLTRYARVLEDTNGDGTGGAWLYEPESEDADNGLTVRRPDDKTPSEAGRWIKM